MDNVHELTQSPADSRAPVKIGLYVVELSFYQMYNVLRGDAVEKVLRRPYPFIKSVYRCLS